MPWMNDCLFFIGWFWWMIKTISELLTGRFWFRFCFVSLQKRTLYTFIFWTYIPRLWFIGHDLLHILVSSYLISLVHYVMLYNPFGQADYQFWGIQPDPKLGQVHFSIRKCKLMSDLKRLFVNIGDNKQFVGHTHLKNEQIDITHILPLASLWYTW